MIGLDPGPRWKASAEGSSRAVGLIRIALALIIWTRLGGPSGFFQATDWGDVLAEAIFFAVSTAMLIGWRARTATALTALMIAYHYVWLGFIEGQSYNQGHHLYLLMIATGLLALTPCGRSFSADRVQNPDLPETGPLWAQNLIVLQLTAMYFWTAVDKTGAHFLSGERLEAIFILIHQGRPLYDLLSMPGVAMALAIGVVLLEYFLAAVIMIRRLHWIAVPAGISLHAGFFLMLPVSTYSITAITLYLAVVAPEAVHRATDRLIGRS
ncbi:MAG: HTTM domain-containing protein [Pseudomonadota bacterium]